MMVLFIVLGLVFLLVGTLTIAEAPAIVRNVDLVQTLDGATTARHVKSG